MMRVRHNRQGFALIVVLAALSIITLLFAIASSRSIGNRVDTRTDRLVAVRAFEQASLLKLAVLVYGGAEPRLPIDAELPVEWRGQAAMLSLQDAGGLVDLNTAHPELLERFATSLGVTAAQL